jgi:hypothetical protein
MLTGDRQTDLYRHFDTQGRLLYVGISLSTVARLTQHRSSSGWFNKIARVEIEKHPSRRAALEAEKAAILNELPVCNVLLNEAAARKVLHAKKHLANHVSVNERVRWVAYHPMYPICWCDDGVNDAPKDEEVESYLCSEQIVYGIIGKSSVAVKGYCDYCGKDFGWRELARTENPLTDIDGVHLWGDKWPYLPDGGQLSAIDSWCTRHAKSGRLCDFVFISGVESCEQGSGHAEPFIEDDVASYTQWLKESGESGTPPRFMVRNKVLSAWAAACS